MIAQLCFTLFLAWSCLLSTAHVQPNNIFILAGQSNMSGRGGVINGTWNGVVPPECNRNPSVLRFSGAFSWVEAEEPLFKDIDVNTTCGISPGMAFANSLLTKKSSLGVIGLVPWAIGGTKITQWARGTYLYNQLMNRTMAAVKSEGSLRALLWFQGESDTVNLEDARRYKKRLKRFLTNVRHDLNSPTLPVIQVALASGQGPYIKKVRKAQLGIKLPGLSCIDAKGLALAPDFVHLTAHAEIHLGKMFADAFLQTLPRE